MQNKKTQTFVLQRCPILAIANQHWPSPSTAAAAPTARFTSNSTAHLARARLGATLDNPFERERIFARLAQGLSQDYRRQTGLAANLIGLPAVLGLTDCAQVLHDAEDALEAHLFEIPTLPPSVPGLRLQRALDRVSQS